MKINEDGFTTFTEDEVVDGKDCPKTIFIYDCWVTVKGSIAFDTVWLAKGGVLETFDDFDVSIVNMIVVDMSSRYIHRKMSIAKESMALCE